MKNKNISKIKVFQNVKPVIFERGRELRKEMTDIKPYLL